MPTDQPILTGRSALSTVECNSQTERPNFDPLLDHEVMGREASMVDATWRKWEVRLSDALRQSRWPAAGAAGLLLVGCGGGDSASQWHDSDGPTEAVRQIQGDSDHCDFGSITYIQVGDQREAAYVRDPEGLVTEWFHGRTQDLDADLPNDATRTPYRREDGSELWMGADRTHIYLVRDNVIERLPLSDPAPWCA
jgi:hypothetical protein